MEAILMADHYNIEMIGRLATDAEVPFRNAVIINNSNEIQYNIKTLSTQNGVKEEIFTGYINSIRNIGPFDFEDDESESDENRIAAFLKYCSDKLFVFTHKKLPNGHINIETATIIKQTLKVDGSRRFIAIPCFSGKSGCNSIKTDTGFDWPLFKSYETYEEFKQAITDGSSIGRVYNFEINVSTDFPEFIIWQDDERMCAIGPIKTAEFSGRGSIILQINPQDWRERVLNDELDDAGEYIVQSPDNLTLFHIDESKYFDIVKELCQPMSTAIPTTKDVESISAPQDTLVLDSTAPDTEATIEPSREVELPTTKNEEDIFHHFRYQSQKNKLFYNPKDITNFHTAVKTGSLVILSGMSGTGKSALVDTYAKALDIKNVLIIPVRPSWSDDSDLLGYVDLIHMVYRPSDTGFIDMIVKAADKDNWDKLFLICLDEMNLARVEHYFSQFLSILEKPVGSRKLVLYDDQYEGKLYNSDKYPHSIFIRDNVKFVGTVNIDESTYHFSDKVLDRANVITLDILDYSNPDNWKPVKYMGTNTPEWTNEDFNKLIKKDDVQFEHQARIRELLWQMHLILHQINSNLGVGPRIVKSIEAYLRNLPEISNEYALSISEGLDYQITQRILTKIRGPREQLESLFIKDSKTQNVLIALLDSFSDVSSFNRSRTIIEQKENELKTYGYCL